MNGVLDAAIEVDQIVQKAFAGRDQDWVDIQGVIEAGRTTLDRILILQELEPLAELAEAHSAVSRLEQLFENHI